MTFRLWQYFSRNIFWYCFMIHSFIWLAKTILNRKPNEKAITWQSWAGWHCPLTLTLLLPHLHLRLLAYQCEQCTNLKANFVHFEKHIHIRNIIWSLKGGLLGLMLVRGGLRWYPWYIGHYSGATNQASPSTSTTEITTAPGRVAIWKRMQF